MVYFGKKEKEVYHMEEKFVEIINEMAEVAEYSTTKKITGSFT